MLYNIQALRAVAAAMVVMYHLQPVLALGGIDAHGLSFGKAGVDLFFVISGFVMVHATTRRPVGAGAFLVNRIARVVPLYWLLTGLACLAGLFAPALLQIVTPDLPNLIRSLLFVPYVSAKGDVMPILLVGWTLNYEMAFYLVFAAGLAATRGRIGGTIAVVTAVLAGAVAAGGILAPDAIVLRFFSSPLLLEFCFGMLLARAGAPERTLSVVLLIAGAVALVISTEFWLVAPRGLVSGIPALAVVAGAVGLEAGDRRAPWRWLQLLGAASYSLYLSHPFLLGAAVWLGHGLATPAEVVPFAMLTFAAALCAAVLLYLAVERPLTRLLRRQAGHDRMAAEFTDSGGDKATAPR